MCGVRCTTYCRYCKGGKAEFCQDLVTYRFRAGGMAMHHPSLPHASMHNTTADRWRRVIILRCAL
jgi:hypothetical protein